MKVSSPKTPKLFQFAKDSIEHLRIMHFLKCIINLKGLEKKMDTCHFVCTFYQNNDGFKNCLILCCFKSALSLQRFVLRPTADLEMGKTGRCLAKQLSWPLGIDVDQNIMESGSHTFVYTTHYANCMFRYTNDFSYKLMTSLYLHMLHQ